MTLLFLCKRTRPSIAFCSTYDTSNPASRAISAWCGVSTTSAFCFQQIHVLCQRVQTVRINNNSFFKLQNRARSTSLQQPHSCQFPGQTRPYHSPQQRKQFSPLPVHKKEYHSYLPAKGSVIASVTFCCTISLIQYGTPIVKSAGPAAHRRARRHADRAAHATAPANDKHLAARALVRIRARTGNTLFTKCVAIVCAVSYWSVTRLGFRYPPQPSHRRSPPQETKAAPAYSP